MKIAIVQSNYLPWKGYFDLIKSVDHFIFLDDVQYTKRDWRNRNLIKTASGVEWITIPTKGVSQSTLIDEVQILGVEWINDHKNKFKHNYSRSPFFETNFQFLSNLFDQISEEKYLSKINQFLIIEICKELNIQTTFSTANQKDMFPDSKSERLAHLCSVSGANTYVSGPKAKNYLNEKIFLERGINVEWFDYKIEVYKQLHGEFTPYVTVFDYLFNIHEGK